MPVKHATTRFLPRLALLALLELEGVLEDQVLMWAADFTFAAAMAIPKCRNH